MIDNRSIAGAMSVRIDGPFPPDPVFEPGILAVIGDADLVEHPQHLLHIDRIDSAPDLQHPRPPRVAGGG